MELFLVESELAQIWTFGKLFIAHRFLNFACIEE